jgi:hypothetical protein
VAALVPQIAKIRYDRPGNDVNGKKASMTDHMTELFEGSKGQLFVNSTADFLNEIFWELLWRSTF